MMPTIPSFESCSLIIQNLTVKNFPTQTEAYFLEYMTIRNKIKLNGHGLSLEEQELFWRFSMRLVSQCIRVFFSTTDGRIGIDPLDTGAGDAVVVLYYGDPLYLLRSRGGKHDEFLGMAYVDGLMHGEALDLPDKGPDPEFVLR